MIRVVHHTSCCNNWWPRASSLNWVCCYLIDLDQYYCEWYHVNLHYSSTNNTQMEHNWEMCLNNPLWGYWVQRCTIKATNMFHEKFVITESTWALKTLLIGLVLHSHYSLNWAIANNIWEIFNVNALIEYLFWSSFWKNRCCNSVSTKLEKELNNASCKIK